MTTTELIEKYKDGKTARRCEHSQDAAKLARMCEVLIQGTDAACMCGVLPPEEDGTCVVCQALAECDRIAGEVDNA